MNIFIDNNKIMRTKHLGIIDKIKEKLTTLFVMIIMELISFYLAFKVSQDYRSKIVKFF